MPKETLVLYERALRLLPVLLLSLSPTNTLSSSAEEFPRTVIKCKYFHPTKRLKCIFSSLGSRIKQIQKQL